ncbi:MAG TPA: T9SS type A sorting domain-containing protein [Candidatus Marinimicrobia bacterium]|nr:T9SS type A sorting domain-containing protein [Candidatus Neomarinimicrobiota bacterium]
MYHMWNDDPVNDPMGWEASYMGPMDITYMYGYASSNYFRIFPSSAISIENSDIMYCTWEAYSDTSANRFNFDVFAVRSEDGGATWTEPMNITNTLMLDVDEIHPHLAPRATDEECYIVYMAPDYEVETVTPAASPEDFKQRLWFANLNWGEVSIESGENLPVRFELSQNFPNPFNPQTVISYSLDRTADVRLEVFDLLGRKVQTLVNKEMDAGNHDVVWKGSEQGAGIYFYRLSTDGRSETRKMVLLK